MSRKPSITIWPASVPVIVEFWPEASSATREQRAGERHAQQRREQLVGVLDLGDVGAAGRVEGRGGQDQDRGVDEERERQRHGAVDGGEPDRLALAGSASARSAGVCTSAECRYRLCGITVAPRMPMAM